MNWQSEVLIEGEAEGEVLFLEAPISFWGGVDPETSKITLMGHPQYGEAIAGKMLAIPDLIGSSSSSAVLLELLHRKEAPKALILGMRDAILPVGVVAARQMNWSSIPVVVLRDPSFKTGDIISISRTGLIEKTLEIRLAEDDDVDAVRACAEEAFQQYVDAIGKKPAPMVADFDAFIDAGCVHVATDASGDVIGYIIFFPLEGDMFLENVAVKHSAAGKGVGKRLISLCEKEARLSGCDTVKLYTNEKMTGNISLYPQLGYRETDRRTEDGFKRVFFEKELR
ncbi:MAG: GNAT family N-acetyltransferase [Pseudomonadota bacterium]